VAVVFRQAMMAALLHLVEGGMLTPPPPSRDQIAKARSPNATATRWVTGASTASS